MISRVWQFLTTTSQQRKKTAAALGGKVFAVKCDVGNSEDVAAAFKVVYEKMERVDILINNAGLTRDQPLSQDDGRTVENGNERGSRRSFLLQQAGCG